ncbi:hypothetical protein ONZ43_g5114 [Nemania bipapillata]|uniref:Uncharacterized protein n=1 Tax=Nemania bipapillata TaxID=110536 RepID=A0ACC2IEN9_9PEZI|nr:hypothetical protein ONZ43_g5114 [Nemania bipapillata]
MSMDLDMPMPIAGAAPTQAVTATILCADCGAPIDGMTAIDAKCYDCFKLTKDISQGIQREATLHFCRDCDRWLQRESTHCSYHRNFAQILTEYPKRTFLFLEQLILKHGAHRDTINIKEAKDGIDFYYSARNQAEKFVDFLTSVVPVRVKKSSELISQDSHTAKKSFKFTFSVELIPICKDDLVALPISFAKQADPSTLQTADISAPVYWRAPFGALAEAKDLVEFIVMDCDLVGPTRGKWVLAEVEVARASDLGTNNKTYWARTHLGGLLHAGDSVMGYMLSGTIFNNPEFEAIEQSHTYSSRIPDVVLVKKHFPNRRRNRKRQWKVKRMAKDEGELLPKKADQERMDREFEQFLQDIEQDEEFRAGVQLYKQPKRQPHPDEMSVATTDDGDEDGPQVNMDELLDDFDELTMEDGE